MPEQVAALYRARWEVELLFRELKSRYELDAIRTSKAAIVEVLVLVSILTPVVSWVVLGVLRDEAENRGEDPTFPRERWAITFESFAPLIADRLARYLGYGPPDLLTLMSTEARKKQSRPLLREQVNATLCGDSPA